VFLVVWVADLDLTDQEADKVVTRDARDLDAVFFHQVQRGRHLVIVEISDLLVPDKLELRVLEVRIGHDLECVLEVAADSIGDDA